MLPFFLHLTIQTITFEALLPWFIMFRKIDVDKIVQLMPLKLQLKSKTLFKTIPLKCFFLETLQRYAVKVWNYVRQYCIYSDHGELKFGKNKIQMVTANAANFVWQTNFCLGGGGYPNALFGLSYGLFGPFLTLFNPKT